jgi:hypothetical protein
LIPYASERSLPTSNQDEDFVLDRSGSGEYRKIKAIMGIVRLDVRLMTIYE